MRIRGSILARSGLVTAAVIAASVVVSVAPAQAAPAAPALTCKTAANLFSVRPGGALAVYPHEEPETGAAEYGPIGVIGSGWDDVRTLAAPDGVMYQVHQNGDLYRYRWNGTGWDRFGGLQYRDVGNGWQRFWQTNYRNLITADEQGRIYSVAADGYLRVYTWKGDHATGAFSAGHVIDVKWDQYNMIVAAGDGVLYARKANGDLFRFRWDAGSDRFTQYGPRVGSSWQNFTHVTSAGGDVLYVINPNAGNPATGLLYWNRYNESTNTWAGWKQIGTSWKDELELTGAPDSCKINGFPRPERPAVPRRIDAPNAVIQGTDKLVSFFYVNSAGQLTAAKQRSAGEFQFLETEVISSYDKSTGQPGVGVRSDGRFDVLANSYDDADFRGKLQQTANGPWGPVTATTLHSGWMVGDPVYATESTKALTMYAVDAGGSLWRRNQLAPGNDTYLAWRQFSAPVGLTADFTLVQNGTGIDVVARKADGTVQTATITGTTLSAWRIVGTGAVDRPAAVVHSNGDLQVFVRTADGAIVTQRETNNAFPQVWQPTPAVAAAGAPAALIRPSGLIDLAVRGTDNFVYQSSQVAPAGSFGEWRVQYPQDTATDPTSLVLTDGTPIFTWRSPDGTIQTVFKPNAQFAGQSSRPQPAER